MEEEGVLAWQRVGVGAHKLLEGVGLCPPSDYVRESSVLRGWLGYQPSEERYR